MALDGPIRAINTLPVGAPIEGKVESFAVEVGDEVYEGQLIAQIKNMSLDTANEKAVLDAERLQTRVNNLQASIISARLESSRAGADASRSRSEFERAEKVYERQKMLYGEGATPRLTFEKAQRDYETSKSEYDGLKVIADTAESRIAQLQHDLDEAKKQLEEKNSDLEQAKVSLAAGEVHAPVSGVVVARRGVVGDDVNPSMTDFFVIATDMSRMEVSADVPPNVLPRVRAGQNALVQIAENAGTPLTGMVKRVENGTVVVEFANPNPAIKPGLSAHVVIQLDPLQKAPEPAKKASAG